MNSPHICIDFGSTRTKIARLDDAGAPVLIELGAEVRAVIPSVFYLPKDGGTVLVGDEAVEMADSDPAGLVTGIKREINRPGRIRCGAGRLAPERWELVAALFTHIRERCEQEVFHHQSVETCILTVPVCFNEAQRDKLRKAAEHAGFKTVRMLEEPVAAAMYWLSSSGRQHSEYVVVVDIGGGTTDLAALKLVGDWYEAIADLPHAGFLRGGNDIDEQIRQALVQATPDIANAGGGWLVRLRRLKEQLARDTRSLFKVSLAGQNCEVPREVVAEAVAVFVEKTKSEVRKFLEDFTELTGNRDCPILLAGGGAKLHGMQQQIEDSGDLAKGRVIIWNEGEFAIVKGGLLNVEITGKQAKKRKTTKPLQQPIEEDSQKAERQHAEEAEEEERARDQARLEEKERKARERAEAKRLREEAAEMRLAEKAAEEARELEEAEREEKEHKERKARKRAEARRWQAEAAVIEDTTPPPPVAPVPASSGNKGGCLVMVCMLVGAVIGTICGEFVGSFIGVCIGGAIGWMISSNN